MEGYVETRREIKFVGLRIVALATELPFQVPIARDQLLERQSEIGAVVNTSVQLGVTHPSEAGPTPDHIVTYIGFEVSEFTEPPADMRAILIPAGRYGRFEWRGAFDTEEFDEFYPGIFAWLQDHSLAPRPDSPWVELYDDATHDWQNKDNPSNRLSVLIPLAGAGV
jgi:predicted transcriptional regulator YdeE